MTTTITLPQSINVNLLKAALLFTSTEETRHYLRGVHMRRRGHTLRYAATDGHRLFCAMQGFPRTRGDRPALRKPKQSGRRVPPHTRG